MSEERAYRSEPARWALARPAGMMQGRGPMLAFWDDVLPKLPAELAAEHHRIVAQAMARGGGEAA